MKRGSLIIFVGPTGSGKTSLMKKLILEEKLRLLFIPTYTTRRQRINEIDGKDYFFLNEKDFLKLKEDDFFVETSFLNENYYGTSKETLNFLKNGKNVIKILDSKGFIEWKKIYKNVYGIFIDINDKEIISRIGFRNEKIEENFLNERIEKGKEERKKLEIGIFDKYVFNSNFEKCFFEIRNFLEKILKN